MARTKKRTPKGATHSCRSRKSGDRACVWCQSNRTHRNQKALAKARAGEFDR